MALVFHSLHNMIFALNFTSSFLSLPLQTEGYFPLHKITSKKYSSCVVQCYSQILQSTVRLGTLITFIFRVAATRCMCDCVKTLKVQRVKSIHKLTLSTFHLLLFYTLVCTRSLSADSERELLSACKVQLAKNTCLHVQPLPAAAAAVGWVWLSSSKPVHVLHNLELPSNDATLTETSQFLTNVYIHHIGSFSYQYMA